MKKLTQKYVKSILDYDPETGIFKWKYRSNMRKCWNNRLAEKITGCKGKAAILLRIDDALYKAHRIAWLYVYGKFPKKHIDHIDMDITNNRISNLRLATRSQNQCNRGVQSNNTSGHKGVSFDKKQKKWHAYIKINNKRKHIGYFKILSDACKNYCKWAKILHGDFMRIK